MRARNIKPAFFLNEELGEADPLYSVIFAGLWCLADREGRLEDRPARIHAAINPYRPGASTRQALDWLVTHNFVQRYTVSSTSYLQVVKFEEHQHPHVKEPKSTIPPNPNSLISGEPEQTPDKPGASTGSAPDKPGAKPSDSGFRIPEVKRRNRANGAPKTETPTEAPDPRQVWDTLIESDGAIRDGRIQGAIDAIGGWMKIKQRTPRDQDVIRSEFIRAYRGQPK